jgi:hypothetical protein
MYVSLTFWRIEKQVADWDKIISRLQGDFGCSTSAPSSGAAGYTKYIERTWHNFHPQSPNIPRLNNNPQCFNNTLCHYSLNGNNDVSQHTALSAKET